MALMIMGSSGGCCGRSGSALPDITMHAGAGARGASSVSATNIEIGRAAGHTPGWRRGLGGATPHQAFEAVESCLRRRRRKRSKAGTNGAFPVFLPTERRSEIIIANS